jgi:hypothetical protein
MVAEYDGDVQAAEGASNSPTEKQAMQRHYDHYEALAGAGRLAEADADQWEIAQERKRLGLLE